MHSGAKPNSGGFESWLARVCQSSVFLGHFAPAPAARAQVRCGSHTPHAPASPRLNVDKGSGSTRAALPSRAMVAPSCIGVLRWGLTDDGYLWRCSRWRLSPSPVAPPPACLPSHAADSTCARTGIDQKIAARGERGGCRNVSACKARRRQEPSRVPYLLTLFDRLRAGRSCSPSGVSEEPAYSRPAHKPSYRERKMGEDPSQNGDSHDRAADQSANGYDDDGDVFPDRWVSFEIQDDQGRTLLARQAKRAR
jgi:hypothetical protein